MIADGNIVGCSAFMHHVDYDESPRRGSLYLLSTGVLPELQRQGFGQKQKEWQIEYARKHGFEVIVTNMRQSNIPIIRLNEKLGFKFRLIDPNYYEVEPPEPAIVMELHLETTCPKCGKELRTPRAKQCRFCGADWH